jgi:hypothetical protein
MFGEVGMIYQRVHMHSNLIVWFYETKSPSAFHRNCLDRFDDQTGVGVDNTNSRDRAISNPFGDFRRC